MEELRRDHAFFVLAQQLDILRIDEVGAVAAHEPVLGDRVFHALHRGAQHEILDAVRVHVADDDVVGVGLDADDRGRVDRELEALVLVVELDEGVDGFGLEVGVLVEDDLHQGQEQVGVDQDQVGELEAVRQDGEIGVCTIIEQGRVEGHEEREDEHFAEAPDGVVPPAEGDVLVEHAEDEAGEGEDGHQDGREHHEVESERHPADLVVFLQAERVVQEAESDKEGRNQHNIKELLLVGLSDAQSSVHKPGLSF